MYLGPKLYRGAASLHPTVSVGRCASDGARPGCAPAGSDAKFARAAISPNLSPFALKVETFLRMAGFQYVVDTSKPLGPKGKCPWITVNGVDVTDSELIIEHLLTLRPHALPAYRALTPQQHALGRVVQVALDEHLVLAMAAHRFVVDGMRHLVPMMAPRYRRRYRLLRPLAALWATASFRSIGWDRDREELVALMHRDLTALADLLGDRPYLLGDEVTPYDAAVFGYES
ncbi:failed axon connections homolog [Pollicipes pollicipes]|uniref:failed axon connections homolog n=1 Tax=Pollicipes pollicipes TaxID=41117 RepID=UPI001884DD6A|nr:failed axon connections homolog [Pollicipes pollicipes]